MPGSNRRLAAPQRVWEGDMEAGFWHHRWHSGDIGFHADEVNPLLIAHVDALSLHAGARVFVPLCGKTRDIGWLLAEGYRVVGVELSELAVRQLFDDLGVAPDLARAGDLTRYRADGIEVFVGDVFALAAERLGPVDAVYDRAALVALRDDLRRRYAAHLGGIVGDAPQLLITYEYDPAQMDGPPFSVGEDELRSLYGTRYRLASLAREHVPGGLKGRVDVVHAVWHLTPRD